VLRVEKDIEFMVRDNDCVWQVTCTTPKFPSTTCRELIAPEETIDRATTTGTEICTVGPLQLLLLLRVWVEWKEQGWVCGGGCEKFFLDFQVNNAGLYALLLRKTTCGQILGLRGGLIDSLGADDKKRIGVENLARGSTPRTLSSLPSTCTLCYCYCCCCSSCCYYCTITTTYRCKSVHVLKHQSATHQIRKC